MREEGEKIKPDEPRVVLYLLWAFLCAALSLLLYLFSPYNNTIYCKSYSEKIFDSIKPGDKESSVLAKFGPPLWKWYHLHGPAEWHYSMPLDDDNFGHRNYRYVLVDEKKGEVLGTRKRVQWAITEFKFKSLYPSWLRQ